MEIALGLEVCKKGPSKANAPLCSAGRRQGPGDKNEETWAEVEIPQVHGTCLYSE